MDAPSAGGLGGTFTGNPVSCEAALAVLEMVRMQAVQIFQRDLFGEIALGQGERFNDAFEQPITQIEEEYK